MMKSKRFLWNTAKRGLLFNFLVLLLSIYGCSEKIEPSYKENQTPEIVKKICKEEYNLEVTTKRTGSTVWIYAPLKKVLHSEFGEKEDKIFSEELSEKLRNIITTIGRVLISSDNMAEFFALTVSDIDIGLDYTIIGNSLDMKKAYAGFLPWTESNRRFVVSLNMNPDAINDTQGTHFSTFDITLQDFLANQIAQRIATEFSAEDNKNYFKVEKSEGMYTQGEFIFNYSIKKLEKKPKEEINIREKILDITAYCLKSYEFKDFHSVELNNLLTEDKTYLNKKAILARKSL